MPSETLFYRARGSTRYHRDRQCFYLRRARARDDVVGFHAPDPGVGESLRADGFEYRSCARCGR